MALRRTVARRAYWPVDADTDPSIALGALGWSYHLPQNMHAPQRQNRTMAMPYSGVVVNKYPSVWIGADVHPAYRVALAPYLSKLAMTRAVPPTPPAEAAADFAAKAPLVGHEGSRYGWLAKVAHLCGLHRTAAEVLPLWQSAGCHVAFVTGDAKPSAALAKAMVFCTAAAATPEWADFFRCCLKGKWDATPHFCHQLWSEVLMAAGRTKDEEALFLVLDELVDLQVDLDKLSNAPLVEAINSVTTDAGYDRLKRWLFHLSEDKSSRLQRRYVAMRSAAELEHEGAVDLPVNDRIFYHVHWHARFRGPMPFTPRQLFFDYTPATSMEGDAKAVKRKVDDIIADKVAQMKADGLLPEDYDAKKEISVSDYEDKFRSSTRSERWKAKPKWMDDPKHGMNQGA